MTPGFIIELTSMPNMESAGIDFLAPPDRTNSFRTHLQTLLQTMFQSKGIQYTLSEGVKAGVSGIAIEVSMSPVLSVLKERAPVAQDIERRFYNLFRKTAQVDLDVSLPEIEGLNVIYSFTVSVRSKADQRQEIEFMLNNELITKEDALMMLRPDKYKTVEDARKALPKEKEKEPAPKPDAGTGFVGPNPGSVDMIDGADQGLRTDDE